MNRRRLRNPSVGTRFALALVATACLAAAAAAALATWDQARVTGIAKELATASDAFEQTVRKQPGGTVGSGDAENVFGMQQETRALSEQSRALAGHLAAGKGHDETANYYKRLKESADDIAENAQRSNLDEPTMDAWAKVADLMRQLAPYYDPKAD
jgi:hypothetical protein